MIYVGIDDTDTLDSPGTNQLARALVRLIADRWRCLLIIRHQLLEDPRVPCTSHNGSASILLDAQNGAAVEPLIGELRAEMCRRFVAGSDPGLCVAEAVPGPVAEFAGRCKRQFVEQREARDLAARHKLYLRGLGGTEGGVIGALAAVGLAAGGDDGRIVQIGDWPDDLSGEQEIAAIDKRGVQVQCLESSQLITSGRVDVGKHLRPNYRKGKVVLFVERAEPAGSAEWRAVRLK